MNDQLSPTLELRSPHSVSQFSAVGLEHRQNAIPDPTTFNDMLDFKMFPKQRNFVKDMRKHSGSFLIKLFLSIILIVASQFTQAQTIGQSAVSRSYLDSSQGILNADNTNLSSYINYRVSSYQFYSSAAGRQITPVLVEDTGSSLIVRGIGATRTAANGVNNFSFSLVSGSDVIANSNYRLGWRNGPTSTAAQQGVVNWNSGGASYDLHQPGGSSSISVGGSYGIDAQSPFSRTYSINWTLATPVDSEPTSQAYSASATSGLNSSSLSWGRGNGTNVIVFAAQTTGGSPSISDGSSYFASSSFGSGSSAGAGWYCVYNSSGSNVTVTNLSQNTNYRFAVYEYNNTYGTYNYNQSVGSNLINTTTDTPPTVTSITVPGSSTGAFPITINFSENVTGFDITDLSVGNGNASNFQTLSSSQYTADIAPLADGTTTIDIGIGLFQDFAGNANTAAANQASVTVTAKLALNFNGSNENVTIARTAITEGLTYEAWIKTSTTAGDPSYAGAPGMAIIGDYNNDVGFSFGLTNGLLEMNHFTSSWQTVSGTNSVANGSWHHVAVSHDKASGDVVLYLDGSVEVTGNIPWSAVADYHSFNRIGSTYTSGTLDGQFFQGDMDEVRIWNKPLSLAHINYYMDNELTGNEVGLIACYNFEEGTGTDLINVEGTTALNGSLQNMDNTNWSGGNASIGAPLGTEPDFVMDFDGTTQYVEVADDDAFSFGDGTTDQKLSMEAWVNFDVVTLQTIVSKRASASEWHFVIGSSGNPSIILMDNSAGGYIEKESTGISFTPGEWYHLAFTYDGSGTGNGITIYVDGTDVGGNATIVGSYTAMENTTSPVQIGTVNGGATFPTNGRLDEVRIWSVERTAAQINAFKDVELNGGEPNLVGYWNFENAGGSTIPDLAITDGAQNGTMTNMDPANDYVLQSNVANAGAQDTTPPSPTIATSSATTDSPIAIDIDFGEVVVNFEEADLTVVNAIIHNFTNVDGQNYTADLYANAAGTVTADISAGVANDLTGNASLIASQFSISANSPNNALAFSASDYVSIPHDPLFDLADDFTVEFWFNHTTSGNVIIIEKGNNNAEWSIQQSSGLKIILNIGNSATSTNGTYNDGNWHHAVVIYRGANDASIYIDGVDDTDNVNVGTPNYATYDGDVNIGGRGTSNSYNGTLDEIRIWDDERTFGEIQSFQNSSLIGNEDGLIAYYRFDETSGLNLPDLSGNARDGTLNNMTGTEWTTSTAFVLSSPTNLVAYASSPTEITLKWTDNSISENNYLIERADDFGFTTNVTTVDATLLANATTYVHSAGTNTGYFYRVTPTNGSEDASSQSSVEFATTDAFPGSGMEFTALTDRVVISNPENFEENILTVEAWVNTTSTTDFSRVAACGDGGGQRWSLNVNGTSWGFPVGKAVATAQFSGGAAYAASITDVNDGQWHHIAATYNLTTTAVQIYVDGVLEGSGSSSGSSTTAAAHVTLGNFHAPWDQSLQGQLDEVKIWNNIKSDFSDRFSPVDLSMAQPNLIGYFPLDENGGTTTVDRSANNNDGTILGATFVTSGAGAIPIYNATAVTTSAFTANWEAIAGGADDLTIEWGTGGSFANNTVLSGGAQNGSSSVVSASLTAGTVYEYRIKATVGGNETAYSDPVSFMVQPGSALPFTGDDFVTVADNSLLEPSGDFTIEYWMNTNAVATQIIIEKGSSNSEYSVQQSSSGEIVLNANGIMRSNAGFNDGNWHHVAIVYRGANNGVIYIDGVDETSSNALGVPAFSASPLVIGSRSGTAFSLEGSIDEVRIWDDERTIGEIQTNQFAAVTGNEQGLVAYYRFDETSGTVLPDLTGNGLDGTLTNMAGTEWTASGAMAPILNEATNVTVNGFTMNWEAIANATGLTFDLDDDSDFSTPILTDVAVSSPTGSTEIVSQDLSAYKNQELHLRIRFAKGAFQSVYSETVSFYVEPNYAFDFDGSNDYVNIPDADELSFGNGSTDSPFSVEAWAKFDNVTSKSIVSKRTGSNEWHMTLSGGGRLSVALVDNSSSGFLFGENNTFTFVTDQWYHLAFSYDGSATAAGIRLYVDGVEIPNSPSSSGTYTAMENTSSPVQIGAINTSTNLMDGQIDEVRIWNVARTESDLIANMNNELTGNEANLVAYYNFSDAGTLLTDLAGLNNGTVNGATRTFPALNIDTAPEINLYDLTITPASTEITVDIKLDGSANLYYVVTQSATAPSAAQILIGHDDENNQAYNYGNYNGVSSAGNFEIGGDNGANDSPFDPEANYHIYWVAYNSPSDYSEVIASAFTTEALPPEVTLTTVPLADANLFQSSSDNLVYKFTMAVTGGSVSTQGFFFGLGGSFSSADFTASGFTLLQNTIDDFGSASVVGSSSYEPGAPVPANSTGWLFDNTYNDGDLIYFYVSADIDAMAGVGNTFNISQPGLNPNFGINEPKTMIDGGLAIGQTFTIITADAIPPTLVSLSPADEAFDVPTTSSTFQLTFDEDMKKGTGNIEFRLASNNTLITTLDVLDPQVSISGAVVTLGVNGLVDCSEGVSVIIPSSALTDLGENTFSGLTSGDWDFYGPTSPVIDFSADMVVDNTNCGGIPSGSLDANDAIFKDGIPAPSSSFDFQWFLNSPGGTPAGSTSSITNLSAGNYYLVVTESSTGCTSDPELFVVMDDFTDVPVLSVSNQPDRFCVNGNGEITVMASSSNEPSDYTFKLYNGIGTATTPIVNEVSIGSTGIIKTDLEEGTYTIEVINNATLCSTIQQTTILENTQLPSINSANVSVSDVTDCGGTDGAIDVSLGVEEDGSSQSAANYSFEWFTGSGTSGAAAGSGAILSAVGQGTYTVKFTNNITGCFSASEFSIGLNDQTDPVAIAQDLTVSLDPSGTATITANDIDNGSFDNCGIADISIDQSSFTCINVGPNPVTLTVTDTNGNQSTAIATVTIVDDSAPTAIAQDLTVSLDPSGTATITANDIDNGSFDNCGVADISIDQSSFTCINVGPNPVTLTVTDTNGNQSTAIATVTIVDDSAPTAIAQDLTVSLDPSGTATITANDIDNGSFDNCGIADISIDQSSFTCINVGPNPVTLTVTDTNGNQSTAIATVTIVDDSAPTAIAQDLTVSLDPSGTATITANDIDNGSFDNCGVADISIDQSSFTCINVGPNPVTLTVTDTNGNQSTAIATVTIVDDSAPTAIAQDLTVSLDPSGTATITANDIDNGSFDNCGVADISIDQSSFTCTHAGPNSVVLTVTDINGNVSQSIATVTVLEDVLPVAVVQDITIGLDENGSAIITPSELDNGSNDNCGIPDLFLDKTAFTCADLGNNIVNFTARDRSGNESSTTAIVTVVDDLPPSVLTQNITEELDATGSAAITAEQIDNGSFDNCMIQNIAVDISSFTCTDVGANLVTFTATDGSGNQTSATATVTVVDAIPPTVLTQNITVELDEAGSVSIAATDLNAGSFDNCEIASFSVDQSSFTCSDLGSNLVNLTVTDVNGNANTAVAYVLVEDNTPPIPLGQDIIVSLDEFGNANINQTEVNNGSNDNCGVSTVVLSNSNFTCADVGANTVEMLVRDGSGNESTTTVTVTVEDNIAPVVSTRDINVTLNTDGTASITASQIDNASIDNCAIAGIGLDKTSFTCEDVGSSLVNLTVTDVNGNSATASATVTVTDATLPIVPIKNVTISLDESGAASIDVADIDNGSSDNCGISTVELSQTGFDCTDLGTNAVTLTVTDVNGNQKTATASVTVLDNNVPTARAQDATISLDQNGFASITAADIDNGSTDNCTISSRVVSVTNFTCVNLGANLVTLTVTDASGNQSMATASVTVTDNIAPIAKAKAINISLDANGVANFTAEDIDNGSSDNCGVASLSADISSFTCAEIGSNTVMLTTTDESGNSTTVETTVIVNDNTSPTVATQDITVSLDATGIVSITPADVDAGSADNCGIADMSLSKTTFTCGNIGTNVVTLTVTDLNGFSSSAPAVVTVVDDLAPVAIAKDLTVYLDQTGMAYIGTNEINDGSNDNCSMGAMSLDVASFSCDNIGENAVVLKVTDLAGNQSTATATVTVVDDKAPMAVAKNLTVSLDENGMANFDADQIDNGSSDNCAVSDTSIDISSFTCAHLGANDVTLTVTDVNGNTSTASATVTVVDNVPPIAVSQNISIELSPEGAGSITVAQIENGSSDNCAIANISLSQSDFDCSHIGENEIQLIIEDDAGNISMSTAIVTVFSLANPQVTTQNITVSLDETGTATITPEQVDNGSVSGCGDPVLSLDKTTFDCTNLGENTVLLTVANTSGTSVSGEAIITVVDNTDPIFTTANKSFDLDENGNVTITSADLVAESEECLTFSLSSYEFSCDNEGQNEVVVTATDAGGNTSEQTATVTILSGEGGTDFEIITSTATQCEGDDVNLMPVVNTMGSALVFSSTSVSTPTTQELNLSSNSAFTIELWFKPASTSRASLISKMSDGGRGYELFFEDGEIGYNLTHNTSGSAVSGKTTNAALSMGEWHHLAFGFDGFQSPSVIIDGTIQNHNIEVNNLTDSLSNSSPLYIGSLGGTQQQFVGAIDEVRIWTEERNLVEIQRLKDVRLDSSFSNLILLYDFENVAAGIVRDKSGYNHHGTVGENALFENRPEKAIDTAKYTFNLLTNIGNENSRAGVLSGSRNPIIARTSAGLSGASSGTIEMWVQWHGTTQDSGYRGAYGVVSSRQYSTRYTSSIIALDNEDPNKAHLIWRPFDQYRNRIVSNRVLDNEWHHVAVTFANNEHRMYIDGELVGSATVTGSMFNIPSSQLIIGGWKFPETVTRTRRYNYRTRRWEVRTQKRIYHEYESFANAGIDEVRVWSRALTQDEIKANKDDFDAKQNGDGLSLYYDFESDFTSGRVLDRSRYRNTGTGVLALGDRPVQFVNPTFLKSGVVVSSKTAMTHVIETTNKISGCSSRDTVYIDIGYPSTPVIASRDNLIVCDEEVGNIRLYMSGISGDPAQSYQWYKDGYRIPNATQANYTASTEGDYRLEVTNSSGCPGISNSITVRSYAISGRILGEATRNSCGKTATIEVEHKNGELFRLQYYYVRYRSWRWYGNWSTATSFEVNPGYRWRVAIASKSCQSRYTDYVYINATHAYESRIANINGSALSTESVDGATQYVTFTGTWVKSYYNHSTSDVDYSWLKDGAEISSDSKIQLNETGIYELIIRNKDGSCEFTGTKLRALAGPSVSLALDTSSGSSCSAGNLQATVDANGIDPSDLKFYWSASYDYVWATTETSFKPYGGYAYQFVVEYKGVRAFSNAVSVPKTEPNISIKAKAAYRCGSRRRPGLVYDANASTNAGNLTYRFYKAYSYFDYRLYKYRVGYKLVETNTTGKYSTYGYGTYSVLASDECNQYVRGSSRLYLNYCGRIYETDDTDVIAADTVVFSADLNLVDLDSLGNETPILVDIGAPMEAPQTDYQFDVSLSPQPAATFTTVKISTMIDHDIEQLEISLYDISGQLMQTKTLNDVRAGLSETYLDVSNLAEGVYLYTINSKGHELDAGRLAILKR